MEVRREVCDECSRAEESEEFRRPSTLAPAAELSKLDIFPGTARFLFCGYLFFPFVLLVLYYDVFLFLPAWYSFCGRAGTVERSDQQAFASLKRSIKKCMKRKEII